MSIRLPLGKTGEENCSFSDLSANLPPKNKYFFYLAANPTYSLDDYVRNGLSL